MKFLLTGGTVTLVHLGLVTTLVLLGVPIQAALAMAYVVSLCLHFALNRQWVFATGNGYAFHFSAQGIRYLLTALVSYALNATAIAVLPSLLGIPQLAAFFLATCVIGCMSFLALHLWIFQPNPASGDGAE